MSNAVLSAHVKTRKVDESIVLAEPRPEFTPSWHPFSHGEVIEAIGQAVAQAGFKVERKEYSIKPGMQMFGVWEVNKTDHEKEIRYAIGLRNSINKTMSVGLCAGERVFVCDNMVFSSDYVLFRKHTGRLDSEELTLMASEALAEVMVRWDRLYQWHSELKNFELTTTQASVLAVAAIRRDIIPASQYPEWDKLYYGMDVDGGKSKYTPTLHGWHGATTELMNDLAFNTNSDKQKLLTSFINHEALPLIELAATKKSFSFPVIEKQAADAALMEKEGKKVAAKELSAGFHAKINGLRKEKRGAERAEKAAKKEAAKAAKAEAKAAKPKKITKAAVPFTEKQLEATGLKAIDKALDEKRKAAKKVQPERGVATLNDVAAGLMFPKPSAKKKAKGQKAYDEKMAKGIRKTARVKARLKMAADADDVKTFTQKAPKGEKVTKAKKAKPDSDDVFFCEGCSGEFKAAEVKRVREGKDHGKLLCFPCFLKHTEAERKAKK